MELTSRELWALIHGILSGGAFLVAFTGGWAGFCSLRPEYVTGLSRAVGDVAAETPVWKHRGVGLIPFEEASPGLRGSHAVSVRELPVGRIVGSAGRDVMLSITVPAARKLGC